MYVHWIDIFHSRGFQSSTKFQFIRSIEYWNFVDTNDDRFLGVFIICSALVADAIIGNYQEKVMKTHHVSNVEMVKEKKFRFVC